MDPLKTTISRLLGALGSLASVSAIVALSISIVACAPTVPAGTPPAASPPIAQQQAAPPSAPSTAASSVAAPSGANATTTSSVPVPTTNVVVYLTRGEFLGAGAARRVTAASPAKGVMLQLLAGPTSAEKSWGLGTEIPTGTTLRSVGIAGGVATVDLSKRFEAGGGTLTMQLRIAQVVETLTQFGGVSRVAFKINGKNVSSIGGEGIMVSPPVRHADVVSALPAIMLEEPLPGARLKSPARLRGSADVFEGQFRARVTDAAGRIVAEQPVKTTSGTGTRGTFDALLPFVVSKHGKGWITVFEPSAKGGTPTNVVKVRVDL